MSSRARKERKRAGKKFVRTPKVATPPEERSGVLFTADGKKRSVAAVERALAKHGTDLLAVHSRRGLDKKPATTTRKAGRR